LKEINFEALLQKKPDAGFGKQLILVLAKCLGLSGDVGRSRLPDAFQAIIELTYRRLLHIPFSKTMRI